MIVTPEGLPPPGLIGCDSFQHADDPRPVESNELRFDICIGPKRAVELGKAAVERSGVKPEDVKKLLVGNILSGALRPNAARQIEIGAGAPSKFRHF